MAANRSAGKGRRIIRASEVGPMPIARTPVVGDGAGRAQMTRSACGWLGGRAARLGRPDCPDSSSYLLLVLAGLAGLAWLISGWAG
jgi:hypothetical protein